MTPYYAAKPRQQGVLDYSSSCLQQCQNSFGETVWGRVVLQGDKNSNSSKTAATSQEGRTKQLEKKNLANK